MRYSKSMEKFSLFLKMLHLWKSTINLSFIRWLLTGLVASQEETTTKRNTNFLSRKPNRNNRPKPKPRSTTPAPDEDEEVPTSPHCPEPDGFFADSEQCDKYYACRYGNCRSVIYFFLHSVNLLITVAMTLLSTTNPFLPKLILVCITFSHIARACVTFYWTVFNTVQIFNTNHILSSHDIQYVRQWIEMQFCFFFSNGRMEEKLCPDGML